MYKNQFGFQRLIGSNEALTMVNDFIHSKLDKSLPSFLDLSKTSVTVSSEILLKNYVHVS